MHQSAFYAHDIVIPKADPAAARKLLVEAGHPNGIKIQLIVPVGRAVRERLGVTLQQLAQPAGFDIDVQRVPFSSYDAEVSGKAPFYIDGYFARPTVDTHVPVPALRRKLERETVALQECRRGSGAGCRSADWR